MLEEYSRVKMDKDYGEEVFGPVAMLSRFMNIKFNSRAMASAAEIAYILSQFLIFNAGNTYTTYP